MVTNRGLTPTATHGARLRGENMDQPAALPPLPGTMQSLYLETCFENGTPYLRPVPQEDDPRVSQPESVLESFPLKVDFKVHAFA